MGGQDVGEFWSVHQRFENGGVRTGRVAKDIFDPGGNQLLTKGFTSRA